MMQQLQKGKFIFSHSFSAPLSLQENFGTTRALLNRIAPALRRAHRFPRNTIRHFLLFCHFTAPPLFSRMLSHFVLLKGFSAVLLEGRKRGSGFTQFDAGF